MQLAHAGLHEVGDAQRAHSAASEDAYLSEARVGEARKRDDGVGRWGAGTHPAPALGHEARQLASTSLCSRGTATAEDAMNPHFHARLRSRTQLRAQLVPTRLVRPRTCL